MSKQWIWTASPFIIYQLDIQAKETVHKKQVAWHEIFGLILVPSGLTKSILAQQVNKNMVKAVN